MNADEAGIESRADKSPNPIRKSRSLVAVRDDAGMGCKFFALRFEMTPGGNLAVNERE
jgi:hypothetical protein